MTHAGCGESQPVDPEASEKQFLLGADYFQKGMQRPALEELLKAVKLNPRNSDALHLLGILSLREAADSEGMIDQQACLPKEDAKLMRQEVDRHFREAEERFRKAVEVKPDFSDAWNSLAVVMLHFHRWDEAISATEKALSNAIYTQPWAAQGNLGWALFQKGDYLRAAKELREAIFANPQFCVGRYRLAKVFYEQKNLDGAMEQLTALAADPKCPIQEAYHLLGLTALKVNDREKSQAAFKRCVELAPKSCLAKECRIASAAP